MPITKCETYALHAGTQSDSPIMRHICLARACLPQNATHMYRTMHAPCSSHAVQVTCLARLLSGQLKTLLEQVSKYFREP